MRRIITIALVLCLTVTPCHALTLFQTDYDGDGWETERVAYQAPSFGPAGHLPPEGEGKTSADWLPLRELAGVLPYEVEWKDRTVYIYAGRTHTIQPDWWLPPDAQIVDGVTYVTPKYLNGILGGQAFFYDGELYVYGGETKRSQLVRGSESFRANALTVLYRLKLALPEDYKLIRNSLTGGIQQEEPEEGLLTYAAYTYPSARRPVAYIVADCSGANLAELIAHEACHAAGKGETQAREYGRRVKQDLLNIT